MGRKVADFALDHYFGRRRPRRLTRRLTRTTSASWVRGTPRAQPGLTSAEPAGWGAVAQDRRDAARRDPGRHGRDRRLGARRAAARGRARPVLRGHDLAPHRLRDRPDPHRHRRRDHRRDPRGRGELLDDPVRPLRGRLPAVRSRLHHPRGRPEPRLLRVLLVGRSPRDDRPAHLRHPGRQRVRRASALDRAGAPALGRPRPVPVGCSTSSCRAPRGWASSSSSGGSCSSARPRSARRSRASTTSSPTRRSSGRPGRGRAGWRLPAPLIVGLFLLFAILGVVALILLGSQVSDILSRIGDSI